MLSSDLFLLPWLSSMCSLQHSEQLDTWSCLVLRENGTENDDFHPSIHSFIRYLLKKSETRLQEFIIQKWVRHSLCPFRGGKECKLIIAISVKSTIIGADIRHNSGPLKRWYTQSEESEETWLNLPNQNSLLLFLDFYGVQSINAQSRRIIL